MGFETQPRPLLWRARKTRLIPVRVTNTKRTLLEGVLFALLTRWNLTFAVASTCRFVDTVCGEVRIPPTGGILRRAEIYQKIATDLEIRNTITPHSKFPYDLLRTKPIFKGCLPLGLNNFIIAHKNARRCQNEHRLVFVLVEFSFFAESGFKK